MNCPFCSELMEPGHIYGPGARVPIWLPEDSPVLEDWRLTTTKIEQAGGCLLGEAHSAGLFQKKLSASYYCRKCGCIVTNLNE